MMKKKKIVLATNNKNKVFEILKILGESQYHLLSLEDFPDMLEIVEDGATFLENAQKKALAAFQYTGLPSLADDSGLEVDFLSGAPGVHSKRFAGQDGDSQKNNDKLLRMLHNIPWDKRTAQFKTVVSFIDKNNSFWCEGICRGVILTELKGEGGFGYDPLFYYQKMAKTFAELSPDEKNKISHRGIAFRKMADLLGKSF